VGYGDWSKDDGLGGEDGWSAEEDWDEEASWDEVEARLTGECSRQGCKARPRLLYHPPVPLCIHVYHRRFAAEWPEVNKKSSSRVSFVNQKPR